MSRRRVSSPAGNYYKFVYDEDSEVDDDNNDDNDNILPPVNDEPELLREMYDFGAVCGF